MPRTDNIETIMAAIRAIESGANYTARNSNSTASGAYQFLDSTWNHYAGYAHAWQAPPAVQDEYAHKLMSGLYNYWLKKFNNDSTKAVQYVAASWFVGGGNAGSKNWGWVPPGNSISIQGYVDRFMSAYGQPPPPGGYTKPPGGGGPNSNSVVGNYLGAPITKTDLQSLTAAYNSKMATYGFKPLSGSQVWNLIHHNVTPELWDFRLQALRTINDNKNYLDAFQKVIGKKLSLQDRLNIATGKAPPDWYRIWNKAAVGGAAESEGFKFAPKATKFQQRAGAGDLLLTSKDLATFLQKIGGSPNPNTSEYEKALAQAALAIHAYLPQSRYSGLGLKKSDLLDVAIGKGSAKAQEIVDRLAKEEQLFQRGQDFGGITGLSKGQPVIPGLEGLSGKASGAQ